MIDRESLRTLAAALPAGSAVPVPREWLLELLAGERERPSTAGSSVDLTVRDLAGRFGRAPSTIRSWCELGRFPGAYLFNGREWRIPAAALDAFEAQQRERSTPTPRPTPPSSSRRRGRVVDLGAWRKVG